MGNTKIEIPEQLAKKIEQKIKGTGFKTLSEYVTFVLKEMFSETLEDDGEALSKEDEKIVKDRLRALGYLD